MKLQEHNEQLCKDYHSIVVPDRKLEDLRNGLADLWQHGIQKLIDYLNWDKYLLVQSIVKTINKGNSTEVTAYLDGALSRNDALIVTLAKLLKPTKKIDDSD